MLHRISREKLRRGNNMGEGDILYNVWKHMSKKIILDKKKSHLIYQEMPFIKHKKEKPNK